MGRIRNAIIGVVLVTSTAMGFTDYEPENMGFQITDLGSINGEVSFANDISDANQACGQYEDYDGIWKPCVFSSGWPQNIDGVDDAVGAANAINHRWPGRGLDEYVRWQSRLHHPHAGTRYRALPRGRHESRHGTQLGG